MLRLFLVVVVFGFFMNTVYGQAKVRLNLVVNQVQNIVINPDQTTLSLVYSNLEDYQRGVELIKRAHITVFSTEAFEVKVRLANEEFSRLDNSGVQKVKLPNVKVKASSSTAISAVTFPQANLNTHGSTLIRSNVPIMGTDFDVTYKGPGGNDLVPFVDKAKKVVYSNEVLFSIETR